MKRGNRDFPLQSQSEVKRHAPLCIPPDIETRRKCFQCLQRSLEFWVDHVGLLLFPLLKDDENVKVCLVTDARFPPHLD